MQCIHYGCLAFHVQQQSGGVAGAMNPSGMSVGQPSSMAPGQQQVCVCV